MSFAAVDNRPPGVQEQVQSIYNNRYPKFKMSPVKRPLSPPSVGVPGGVLRDCPQVKHPDVVFQPVPFHHKMDTLVKPVALGNVG